MTGLPEQGWPYPLWEWGPKEPMKPGKSGTPLWQGPSTDLKLAIGSHPALVPSWPPGLHGWLGVVWGHHPSSCAACEGLSQPSESFWNPEEELGWPGDPSIHVAAAHLPPSSGSPAPSEEGLVTQATHRPFQAEFYLENLTAVPQQTHREMLNCPEPQFPQHGSGRGGLGQVPPQVLFAVTGVVSAGAAGRGKSPPPPTGLSSWLLS